MEFTNDYKSLCYHAFIFDKDINELMDYLDLGLKTSVRMFMEDNLDKLNQEILQPIGKGEESIHNARVEYYNKRRECYSELIRMIEEEEDAKTAKVEDRGLQE